MDTAPPSLRHALGVIVALASAATGACASSVSNAAASEAGLDAEAPDVSPDATRDVGLDAARDDGVDTVAPDAFDFGTCPHVVVDRSATVALTPADACSLREHAGVYLDGLNPPQPAIALDFCRSSCGDMTVTHCFLPADFDPMARCPGAPDAGASVALTCETTHVGGMFHMECPIPGRRPAGLARAEHIDAPVLGAYFATCAHFEAASVVAFEVLGEELAAHGAPETLVRASALAAVQEVRHAELMGALATRFGARSSVARVERVAVRPLAEFARENVVEGVVRETFAAAQALWGAANARDPDVRRAMCEIAEDECAHASLSWEVAAWASTRLSDDERDAITVSARAAIVALASSVRAAPSNALCDVAGVPDAATSARLVALLDRDLWGQSSLA